MPLRRLPPVAATSRNGNELVQLLDTTIILHHELDDGASAIVGELEEFAATRILHNFFELTVRSNQELDYSADFDGRFSSGSAFEDCRLLDRLSRLGSIGLIRVVCIDASGGTESEEVVSGLSTAVAKVKSSLVQLLGSRVRVIEARIGIRGFGEPLPMQEFFPINANANVLVISHDRISDDGMARPITRANDLVSDHTFALHGAVELSSVLGLWKSMHHAPLDNFAPNIAGSSVPKVRFSQSRVRILIGPPLPMSRLASPDRDLPLPLQHFGVSNVSRASTDLVDEIYPRELVFVADPEPDFLKEIGGGVSGLLQFVKEFARSMLVLPRLVVRGLKGEIDSVASKVYQEALGDETTLRVIGGQNQESGETIGLTQREFEDIVREISSRADREIVSPLSREHWQTILRSYLGVVDGSSSAREVRQRVFGNENILLVDRDALGSCQDLLNIQVAQLLEGGLSESIYGIGLSDENSEDDQLSDRATIEGGDGDTTYDSKVADAGPSAAENADITKDVSSSVRFDVDSQLGEKLAPAAEDIGGRLSRRFVEERISAQSHAASMIIRIRQLVNELHTRDNTSLSSSVVITGWLSMCAVLFAIFTCTPLASPLSFDALSGFTRDALWTSFCGLFILASVLMLGYGGRRTWQIRALITGGSAGVLVAVGVLWFDDIRRAVQVDEGNYIAAVVLAVVTLGMMGLAVFRNLTSSSEARQQLGRLFLVIASVYLVVALIVWQNMETSALRSASDSTRTRLLWAILIVAGVLLVSCVGVVALIQIRERLRLRVNGRLLEWSRQQLEISVDAERILGAGHTQWSATGAVLSRLVTHPLGKHDETFGEISESLSSDESILKYDVARLNLNPEGEAGLVARLRRHFVEPGWLIRQYEKMVKRFQEQAAFSSGNRLEDLIDRRPELDPTVVSPQDALLAMSGGDRWEFARRVFSGEYDAELGAVPEQLDLEEVYQSVLDKPGSYVLEGSQLSNASARGFLEQVLPSPGVELAAGLTRRVFTADDQSRKMNSEMWWPVDILGAPPINSEFVTVNESSSELSDFFGGSVLLAGIRVDLSEPFAYVDCEGAQDLRVSDFRIDVGESEQSDF
jgi:hypothetical protein